MAGVTKQLVPIQFGGGINSKIDPKQLPAGNLLTLENGQFTKQGAINKRFGYDILNTTIEGGGNIDSGVAITTYKDELILFDGNNCYSYLPSTGNWSDRGTAISIITEDKTIINSSAAQQINPDMAFLNNLEVYAWEDSRGGVHYSTMDTNTRAFAVADNILSTTGQQPKCIAFQSQVFIFYTDGDSQIFYQTINPFNPTAVTPPVVIVTDGFSGFNGFPYDVCVIANQLFVGYLGTVPNTGSINLFYIDTLFNKSATSQVEALRGRAINPGFHGAINVVGDSANNCWVSWANGGAIRVARNTYNNTIDLPSTLVDRGDCRVLSAIESPIQLNLLLCYEIFNTNPTNEQVLYNSITSSGTLGIATTVRSVGIASKCWKYLDNIYVNTAYESELQSTDFALLIAQQGEILPTPVVVGKFTPEIGGGLQTNGMCPETVMLEVGIYKFANLMAGKLISEANTLFSLLGVNSTKIEFTPSNNFINTTQANTLLIVGGILQGYDGVSVTELGFNTYPEDIAVVSNIPGSLGTGAGQPNTYQYIVEYQWTDNNKQIYRSAPSIPVSVQVSDGYGCVITGPTLRLTSKSTAPSIVIYRTLANSTNFYRVTSTLAPLLNDPTVDSFTFTDTLSDTSINANELEYTTGGVLSNIAPPANSIITTYNNRVFLAGLSDKLNMWYSQSVVNNTNENTIPPQFCAELTMGVDPRGGDIIALGLLNQSLIIFKATEIFSVQGYGPDATGSNNDYGDPSLVTSDVGCVNQNSIVIMPDGLMFQSTKGIYLLDQSANVSYIGAPVEDFNGFKITSSTLDKLSNLIIFTTAEGTALVYDYYFKQWSTWTNHFAIDATVYNNSFIYLKSDGHVYLQNQNKFTDGSSPVYLSWTLPNLSFAGLQGFQRVFRAYILGTYKGQHTLNVKVAYDYNDIYTQTATISPNSNVTTWGSDPTWGSSTPWGGVYTIYEFRIDFNIQRCTTIRINVSDNQDSTYNEGYSISSVVFEIGVMPGGNRIPSSGTVGAQ